GRGDGDGREDGDGKQAAEAPREKAGLALLRRLHRELVRCGAKEIDHHIWHPRYDDFAFWLMRRAGYGTRPGGSVELCRINSLVQFLQEMVPVYRQRLADSRLWRDWTGTILIEGGSHRACMQIAQGAVRVTGDVPKRTARQRPREPIIVIRGGEEEVQRIALGVASPYEEHLQLRVQMAPAVNRMTKKLLETLFPRVIRE
ncbi:MAG: hypothetical protein KAY24_16550, partial [Candidatus Eisenbacteria sp.]|nr:hypothetical protein [Candidatus Eisenbacteria bacterium]